MNKFLESQLIHIKKFFKFRTSSLSFIVTKYGQMSFFTHLFETDNKFLSKNFFFNIINNIHVLIILKTLELYLKTLEKMYSM